MYTVNIADTQHGKITVTKEDGTEVSNGQTVDEGTLLTYTAVPDKYYDFDTWTDDAADQAEGTFAETLDGNITVGAAFKPRYAKVKIWSVQNGKIQVVTAGGRKVSDGDTVREGTILVCTAVPDAHCDLSAWGADAKGKTGKTVRLRVTKDMSVRAAFKFRYSRVTIAKTVNGQITVKTADGRTLKS